MRAARWLALLTAGAAGIWLAQQGHEPAICGEAPGVAAGQVVDAAGPVADASVGWQGRSERVKTDRAGRYSLSKAPGCGRIIAAKPGYFIGGADAASLPATIELKRHTADDNADYRWVSAAPDPARPEQCGNCHREIYRQWSASPHGKAAVNRRFLNLYEGTDWHGNEGIGWSLLADVPEGRAVCSSCHAPSLDPGSPAFDDLRKIGGVDREGIHCDFCHKIADVSVANVGLDHGRFAMRLVRPPQAEQLFFGPLDDDDRGGSVYSPLYRQSRYCASCHEGTVLGTHVYGEYSEWLGSDYAKRGVECQDCHMQPDGRTTNVAPGRGGIERDPSTLSTHGSSRGDAQTLREHLLLRLSVKRTSRGLEVATEVEPRGIGHRMPTGYPDRSLTLWVRAVDQRGWPLKLLEGPTLPTLAGVGNAADGNLAGQPGRMYAKILEGLDGQVPVPFWRPNRLQSDTRLMPDAVDRASFRFEAAEGSISIEARLIYRHFSKVLADQKHWPDNEVLVRTERARVR